ncbi:Erg28 like protein-domain-containing protein [Phycomyces nitens]|nr:Erg28 like protein-domain-containing protein [Phycomyces nitens]
MEFIMDTISNTFSTMPEGNLPKWLLFTSALGIFNSIQNYCTDSLTKRVYSGTPELVTPMTGRMFATWTWSVSMIRIYAAFHLEHRFMYELAIWTYVIALTHYMSELLIFKGCKISVPFMSPFVVAVSSLIWLTNSYDFYVKY